MSPAAWRVIEFAAFRLDLRDEQLWCGTRSVELRPKTWHVLRHLATNPGRLVTADELLNAVWPNAHVTPGTLSQSIRELRRTLGDDPHEPRIIETVHGRGFRFLAKIRRSRSAEETRPSYSPSLFGMRLNAEVQVLHGREPELERLIKIFRKAECGRRQIVFVIGEAGIGKTSLVRSFLERLAETEEPVWIGWGQCVEHHGAREAYLPILETLDRLAREAGADRLRRALHRWAPTWLQQLPSLLRPDEAPAAPVGVLPARMLREFYLAVEALAAERTLVLCLEDLQWSDAATVDLLSALMKRPEAARLLVLATYRPVDAALCAHPIAALRRSFLLEKAGEDLALELLDEAAVRAYLASRFGMQLDPALASMVCQITDGNPLFMITLVAHFVAEGWLKETEAGWTLTASLDSLRGKAPESLKAVLEARLAQCGTEEVEVLEAASVVGETSAAQAIAAALDVEVVTVEKACGRLAGWGWFLEGVGAAPWPDGSVGERYRFLHATFRRILYDRIPSGRRQSLHLRVARRLEAGYEGEVGEAAELALHCELGGDPERAIDHLAQAAANVQRRFAKREAVAYLTHALELIAALPPSEGRSQRELQLRLLLARSVLIAAGYSAIERDANVARARELAAEVSDFRTQSLILSWQTRSQIAQGNQRTGKTLAEQNGELARHIDDPVLLSQIHTSLGTNALLRGALEMADREHALVPSLLEGLGSGVAMDLLGHDPAVMALGLSAWTAWLRGYPDEALRRSHAALSRAEAGGDAFVLVTALINCGPVEQFRRDGNAVHSLGLSLARLLEEYGFGLVYPSRYAPQGWLRVQRGEFAAGIDDLRENVFAARDAGSLSGFSLLLATLAEAELARENAPEGLAVIDEAQAFVEKSDERFWEAEIHRIRGELLRLHARDDLAEATFETALQVARDQGARSLELRAAMSLARFWKDSNRTRDVRSPLSEIYAGFTQGFDTADLRDAKALLDLL